MLPLTPPNETPGKSVPCCGGSRIRLATLGRTEVYVRPFVAAGSSGVAFLGEGKWQISKDGGQAPLDGGWDVNSGGQRFALDAVPDETQANQVPISLATLTEKRPIDRGSRRHSSGGSPTGSDPHISLSRIRDTRPSEIPGGLHLEASAASARTA